MRPLSGYAPCSGRAWPPTHLGGYRRFFGLRSLLAVSSVASGRIEFVSQDLVDPTALRTIHSLPVALHLASRRRSYFQLLAGSSTREGLSPSDARLLSSARARTLVRLNTGKPDGLLNSPRALKTRTPKRNKFRAPFWRRHDAKDRGRNGG